MSDAYYYVRFEGIDILHIPSALQNKNIRALSRLV